VVGSLQQPAPRARHANDRNQRDTRVQLDASASRVTHGPARHTSGLRNVSYGRNYAVRKPPAPRRGADLRSLTSLLGRWRTNSGSSYPGRGCKLGRIRLDQATKIVPIDDTVVDATATKGAPERVHTHLCVDRLVDLAVVHDEKELRVA
jgi:hypothetical protein